MILKISSLVNKLFIAQHKILYFDWHIGITNYNKILLRTTEWVEQIEESEETPSHHCEGGIANYCEGLVRKGHSIQASG